MRVLVACEFSGIVRDAFAARGHEAWSCDLLPSERPGQHIQADAEMVAYGDRWDLMVAHPPCRYLSRAGARWLYRNGEIDKERERLGMAAARFFMALLNAPIPHIAVENPTPLKAFGLPRPSHSIQPYQFGHPFSKKTLLWLKNLPPLMPTIAETNDKTPLLPSNTGKGRRNGQRFHFASISAKDSARTFEGIAEAMAEQWGRL